MDTHSYPIAELCSTCAEGALFQDHQEFLYETVDSTGRAVLAKSGHTALTVSPLTLLRNDILPHLPLLVESSNKGCHFCGFLRDIISAEDTQDEARRLFGSSFTEMEEPSDISIYIHFRWKNEVERDSRGDGLLGAVILLCFDHDDETEIALYCLAEGLTGSEESDVWLRLGAPSSQSYNENDRFEWMSKMLEEDGKVQDQRHAKSFIPERLISVDDMNPRLVLSADLTAFGVGPKAPTYAALSYCWGPPHDAKQQLTTTTSSIAQRQEGIMTNEMTEVLRDAITVTRALDIPYLWVDALCILQDDISDWQRQCVDIAELYANAVVTICAASSDSCRQGFLRQRGHRIRLPFVSTRRRDLSGSFYLQFKYAGIPRGDVFNEGDADAHHNRWGNRGWVFQEKFAASQKLIFGNANLHYYSSSSIQSMGSDISKQINSFALSHSNLQDKDEVYKSWAHILRRYSRFGGHSFSKISDILPALSGLASQYCKWLQDDYYAGLWKGDIFRGSMWYSTDNSETLPSRECCIPSQFMRHENCPIPSWSPLGRGIFATHGAVYRDNECLSSFQPEYQVLDAYTKPAGSNPFGEIENNWELRVRSHVLDLAKLNVRKLEVYDTFTEPGCRGTLVYEGKHIGCFELDFCYSEYTELYSHPSAGMMDEITRFSWVLLGSCKIRNDNEPPEKMRRSRGACGLILFSIPNSNKYSRVGVFLPGFPENHHDGLLLLKRLGEIKTVIIV